MRSPDLYTASLDLSGAKILIVGGGVVAAQKLKGLPKGAIVTVVSPALSPGARAHVRRLGASVRRRPFRSSDVRGKRLVFACTDGQGVNAAVAREARSAGAWVCVSDAPLLGDLQVPASGRAGRLRFTLSTSGASPALAKALRREWERRLRACGVGWLLGHLGRRRAWLKAHPRQKSALLKALTSAAAVSLMLEPATPSRRRALKALLAKLEASHA